MYLPNYKVSRKSIKNQIDLLISIVWNVKLHVTIISDAFAVI